MENSTEKGRMPEVSRDSDHASPAPPTFETRRLRLRTVQAGDEEFLAALDSDLDVMRYIHSGPFSQKAAMQWAKDQVEMARFRWHFHKWIVELREDHTKVGWVELSKFRGVFDPDEEWMGDDINLGYQFDKAYWAQGFASEAARAVLAHAFDELQLDRVVAYTHKDNVRSARLLERLGFQQRALRRRKDMDGQECRLFALTAEAWRP